MPRFVMGGERDEELLLLYRYLFLDGDEVVKIEQGKDCSLHMWLRTTAGIVCGWTYDVWLKPD